MTDAVQRAGQGLTRLRIVAARAALHRTARSHVPAAAELALRQPVLTARLQPNGINASRRAELEAAEVRDLGSEMA